MAEIKTEKQINYGWGLTFDMSAKAPAISKRIWKTYADALEYVNNINDTAIAGLQLSIINDDDPSKNGIYFVREIGTGSNDGILVKLGGYEVDTYSDAVIVASAYNVGQIIYVKNSEGEYSAGAYIIISGGNLLKLGTTSASGNIESDVEEVKNNITQITENIEILNQTIENKVDKDIIYTKEEINQKLVYDIDLNSESVNAVQNKALHAKFGAMAELINQKFKIEVVTDLPTSEISTNTIYLVAQGSDNFIEYIYLNSQWKKLGANDYYNKNEIDQKLTELYDSIQSLSSDDIDNAINNNL